MPTVSEKQRRAMWAAKEGHSNLGIPKSVGEEFVKASDAKLAAAGIAFVDPLGHALFVRRASPGDHAGEWCFPGGGVEGDESAFEAALREAEEEIGEIADADDQVVLLDRSTSAEGIDYTTFEAHVAEPFIPKLNEESSGWTWALMSDPPRPLHPGVERLLTAGYLPTDKAAMDQRLAFDRATVRTYDADGRLHVALTNISKANVCPYFGREIPDWQQLGLDPDKTYKLFRDPEELAKAAPTFNNVPILSRHEPVTADSHQPALVIGSTGTDAVFDPPYLRNSLVVWARGGIDAIESETAKELSCAYRYQADMKPGTYEGEHFDGVMRSIVGNHVALVAAGRAGADVMVGDEKPKEHVIEMTKSVVLTRKAAVTLGALVGFLKPKLAQDASLDVAALLGGVTAKNFKEKKPAILAGLIEQTKGKVLGKDGKLAADASIDAKDLEKVLEIMEVVQPTEGIDLDPNSGLPMAKLPGKDAGGEGLKEFLRGKLSDDDYSAACSMLDQGASDESEEEKKKREEAEKKKKDEDEKVAKDKAAKDEEAKKNMVTKPAMDAAIADAVKKAGEAAAKNGQAIREAERFVRPWVGDLAIACDSAEAVHRAALKALGVKAGETAHADALPEIIKAQAQPGANRKTVPALATDAAAAKSYFERFPGTERIGAI
jgi:8-oxo-dGTP pyrophosphatase MutT (NUDIX family)